MESRQNDNNMEDFALERVPDNQRKSWRDIASIQIGIVTSIAVLMYGGLVTFMAGFWMGMLSAFIAFIVSSIFMYGMGYISYKEGYSGNVISRAYAFGTKGSALSSLVWGFLIIGIFALENVLIVNSVVFYFNIEQTFIVKAIMFGGLSLLWVVLSIFGAQIIARIAQVMVPLLFLVLIYLAYSLLGNGDFGSIFTTKPQIPGVSKWDGFAVAINTTITLAGLIAITVTDFTRFAKSGKDIAKISLVSSFAMYGVTLFFGAIITGFGYILTTEYFVNTGLDEQSALMAAVTNPGVTLVLGGGILGLLAVFFSQSKVQVGNSYLGAMALVNFSDVLFKWRPGRVVMVIVANILSLLFVFGNILHYIEEFITLGSVLLCSWVVIVLTDYYFVRRVMYKSTSNIRSLEQIPNYNWQGIVAFIASASISMVVNYMGWFTIPFIIAVILASGIYIVASLIKKPSTIILDLPEEQKGELISSEA